MNTGRLRFMSLMCGLAVAALGTPQADAGIMTWDAGQQFKATQVGVSGSTSSAFGPFTLGHADEGSPGTFTAYTPAQHVDSYFGTAFRGFAVGNATQVPIALVNIENTAQAPGITSIGNINPGELWMHPGGIVDAFTPPIHESILRFIAPFTGTYGVSALFRDLDNGTQSGGAGLVDQSIRVNGTNVVNGQAASFFVNTNLVLNAGDALDFAIGQFNDGISYDSTGLTAQISFDTGTTAIPKPSSFALMGLGAVGMLVVSRRRKQKAAV